MVHRAVADRRGVDERHHPLEILDKAVRDFTCVVYYRG